MAANGNNGNTSTGQSAASAQAAAAAGNAAASNAANGNTGTGNTSTSNTSSGNTSNSSTSTNTSTNTSNGATNSAGLMSSLIGFGNAVAKGEVGSGGGSGSGTANKTYSEMQKEIGWNDNRDRNQVFVANLLNIDGRKNLTAEQVAVGDRVYTKARAMGFSEEDAQYVARDAVRGTVPGANKTIPGINTMKGLMQAMGEEDAQFAARDAVRGTIPGANKTIPGLNTMKGLMQAAGFKAKNTGPTYNPATTAMSNVNPTIAAGSSKMGPSTPAAPSNAPGGNLGGETGGIVSGAAPTSVSDATNTGTTNRGSTVTNGGTSVTDSGTGGSISSSINAPSRDASSIGLGVYDNDRANYDQDNWNRGMEVESSSLVSDEECKAFAKRAFMENSEPFKKVRLTIVKKC